MHTPINGWTKSKMIETIKARNIGKQSRDKVSCLYRGPEGNRCAVGCFIPDELYYTGMEHRSVDTLLRTEPGLLPHMPLPTDAMLRLQVIHDSERWADPRPALIDWIKQHVDEVASV